MTRATLIAALAACYDPTLHGGFACPDRSCPEGFQCCSGTCRRACEPADGGARTDAGANADAAARPALRLAIPAYAYPPAIWHDATAAAPAVGLLVLNPDSGPGAMIDAAYVDAVAAARAASIDVVGYVSTGYGSRAEADVMADIAAYDGYAVSGIFLDEVPGTETCAALESRYRSYAAAARALRPAATVVLNPGSATCESYLAWADILLTFEGVPAEYDARQAPAWERTAPAVRFWHAIFNASASDVERVLAAARTRNAGWVYVTDDALPNPWDTLPSYWSALVASVRR